jgi:chromosome segregation ATPase
MTQEDGEPQPDRILGLPLDEAADVVIDRRDGADREEVRQALSHVTDDGVVTAEAVEEALEQVSKVVSTPESRAEFASIELSDARTAAEPFADLDTVAARLDALERRLGSVEQWVSELGPELRSVAVTHPETAVYETAVRTKQLTESANAAQRAADEIYVDAQELQRWLANADVRFDELGGEIDSLAESLDGLANAVDDLATAAADDHDADTDAAVGWVDATLRHRAIGLLFDDFRAELADLRVMAERDGAADAAAADLDGRLDDLEERWTAIGDRLDDLGRPAWHERFDDDLDAFETALDAYDPPIDWGELQETLDEHRSGIEGLS